MRIGVYFTAKKEHGGVYQYSVAILEAFAKIPEHQYVIFSISADIPASVKKYKNFEIIDLGGKAADTSFKIRNYLSSLLEYTVPSLMPLLFRLGIFNSLSPLYRFLNKGTINYLENANTDLIFYPTSSNLSFLTKVPYVVTIHDLQHRINPQFKEVSAGGRWEHREYSFTNMSKTAFKIYVDSPVGQQDMLKYYPIAADKTVQLPYLAPSYIDPRISKNKTSQIKKKFKLPEEYIYYPAKFWPHKNHLRLVKALKILHDQNIKLSLVLTGTKEADFSSYDEVMNLVKALKLTKYVKYLGYVNDDELSALYKLSQALVMPTFFGPTNIPVMEAWVMGVPVLYSDTHGCREQLADAGLLFDLEDPEDIAQKIKSILSDRKLREKVVEKGYKRVGLWNHEMFTKVIRQTLSDFAKIKDNG